VIKRGEIYWVNLDPAIGSEIKKTRPALVVSNDIGNLHAASVTILPITSKTSKVYPFEVLLAPGVFGNKEAAKVKADQIRTVDKRRLGKVMGMIPEATLSDVGRALRLHLGL
jgi:mRNA interferase MazF